MLSLSLRQSGCVGVCTDNLAATGTYRFWLHTKTGDEISKGWHGRSSKRGLGSSIWPLSYSYLEGRSGGWGCPVQPLSAGPQKLEFSDASHRSCVSRRRRDHGPSSGDLILGWFGAGGCGRTVRRVPQRCFWRASASAHRCIALTGLRRDSSRFVATGATGWSASGSGRPGEPSWGTKPEPTRIAGGG